jgi:hypothetical protein
LNREGKDNLWLSIVGHSDQEIHERRTEAELAYDKAFFTGEVHRLNPEIYNGDEENEDPLNGLNEEERSKRMKSNNFDVFDMKLKTNNKEVGSIVPQKQLKLMLLSHWDLYDSAMNSSFFVTNMRLWEEKGRQQLLKLFVKMGVKIQEAKQKFKCMNIDI